MTVAATGTTAAEGGNASTAGSGTAPAGTAAGAAAGTAAASTTPTQDWTSSLSEEARGYVQNKGFKDPGVVLESYRNLEKVLRTPKERLVTLPETDDPAAWNEVHTRLGKPATADGYKLEGKDAELQKAQRAWFHEAGLSDKQAALISKKWDERTTSADTAALSAAKTKLEGETNGLKREWGAAYDQNVNVAKRTAATFGIDGDTLDKIESVMGFPGIMKLMSAIGSKLGEDTFVGGDAGGARAMSPEAARSQMSALKQDKEFIAKLSNGDVGARSEMERLSRFAMHPGA